MGRGIIFDTKNSFTDWGLILTAQEIEPPEVKTKYIEVPLGDGSIDLTEALLGDVSYENRKATFEFDVLCPAADRAALIATIGSHLHGRTRKIYLPDDLTYFYQGRLAMASFKASGVVAKLEVQAICEPYKYKNTLTVYSGTIGAGGSVNLSCSNSRKRVIPEITVSAGVTIVFDGDSYSIGAGTSQNTGIQFVEGTNAVTITGAQGTTYSISYREGAI